MSRKLPTPSEDESASKIDRSVAAVDRTLSILDAFLNHAGPMRLKDIEAATGLFHSVILRYMTTFERMRYIHRQPDGTYELGSRVHELGQAFERRFDLAVYLQPVLQRISLFSGESASFYVVEDGKRVCLYRHESAQTLKVAVKAGVPLPLDETSTGQVLWEFSSRPGWAGQPDEKLVRKSTGIYDTWTASISTPVFGSGDRLLGALTVSGPHFRFDIHSEATHRFLLQEAVALSGELGFRGETPALQVR